MLSNLLLLAGAVAAGYANETTEANSTLTVFTTYCPEATTFVVNNVTYTAEGPTTITITDCPCTVEPASSSKPAAATTSATISTLTGGAAKAGAAGLAAVVGVAAYIL